MEEQNETMDQETPDQAQPESGFASNISGDVVHFVDGIAAGITVKQDMTMTDSVAIGVAVGRDMELSDGGATSIAVGHDLDLMNGGAFSIRVGGSAEITNGGAALLFGQEVTAQNSTIGVLLTRGASLENSKVLLDTRQAAFFGAAFGAAFALVFSLLGLLFRRR